MDFLDENNILPPESVDGVALNKLHKIRNPLVRFRKSTDESTLLGRKMESVRENPEEIAPTTHEMLKADAEKILKTCFSVSEIFGVGHSVEG